MHRFEWGRRPRNFKCPQCPKMFTSKQHRTAHVRAIHEKRRDYGCGTCGQTFSRKSAQVSHVRYVHEGRREHECPHCSWRFGRKNGLNKHVASVHDKSRDYVCECGASFSRKDCLIRHQRGMHNPVASKGYRDPVCYAVVASGSSGTRLGSTMSSMVGQSERFATSTVSSGQLSPAPHVSNES